MKDTEILKTALEKALRESNEVHIKDVALKLNIKHINTDELIKICKCLLKTFLEYKLIKFLSPGQRPESVSLFESGVLTCCKYD